MSRGTAQSGQVGLSRHLPHSSPPAAPQPRSPGGRPAGTWRYLPQAVLVTFATVVLPLLLVELLEVITGERSIPLSIAMAVALSAGIATAGAWLWQRRPASRDILFGDLMVLGFVRRLRAERHIGEVTRLLRVDPLSADGVRPVREERIEILERLARSLDARDPFMLGHSHRVARSAQMVAERMGLPPETGREGAARGLRARHRQDQHPRANPEQAERADRGGVRGHKTSSRRRRAHARAARRSRGLGDGAPPSRAPRRQRLPGRPGGRGDPARRADHRGGGHLRRDHLGPPLQAAAQAAGRSEGLEGGGGHATRSAGRDGVPQLLLGPQDGRVVGAGAWRSRSGLPGW